MRPCRRAARTHRQPCALYLLVSYARQMTFRTHALALAHQSKSPVTWNRAVQSPFSFASDASRATLDITAQIRNLVAIDRALGRAAESSVCIADFPTVEIDDHCSPSLAKGSHITRATEIRRMCCHEATADKKMIEISKGRPQEGRTRPQTRRDRPNARKSPLRDSRRRLTRGNVA
jgi:hypothetical protein